MVDPTIIYETADFLAINKPSGLMVHAARGAKLDPLKQPPTLVDWLLKHRPEIKDVGDDPTLRPGIVHRLDKETSGVMLVAKNQPTFLYLKSLFQAHEVTKQYIAIIRGIPRETKGVIDAPIGIQNGTLRRSIHATKMRKEAITEYEVVKTINPSPIKQPLAILKVFPRTGRTHQIRVHLASIGHPILGDRLYGSKTIIEYRLMLHAAAIAFQEPNGTMVRIDADLPSDWLSTEMSFAS
jgi:23S rRNA pseudouridine1911/1915/1917 synthase